MNIHELLCFSGLWAMHAGVLQYFLFFIGVGIIEARLQNQIHLSPVRIPSRAILLPLSPPFQLQGLQMRKVGLLPQPLEVLKVCEYQIQGMDSCYNREYVCPWTSRVFFFFLFNLSLCLLLFQSLFVQLNTDQANFPSPQLKFFVMAIALLLVIISESW